MYALCTVRVQYPLINISEQFVQVSVRLSNKYWIWWSWAKFAEIFLFLWIIHALFWLASLNFCEGNLINCINAYIHIWKQLHVLVFITSKTCSFSYLQKTKETCFLNHYGRFRIIMNIHESKKTSLVGVWSVSPCEIIYQYLSWARMLAQVGHWCGMRPEYLEKMHMSKQVTIDALNNKYFWVSKIQSVPVL